MSASAFAYYLSALLLAAAARAQAPAAAVAVGANVDGASSASRTLPFVNLMRQADPFGSLAAPGDGSCAVDSATGWPAQADFGVQFIALPPSALSAPAVGGSYAFSAAGNVSGGITLAGGTQGSVSGQAYDAARDVTVAVVTLAQPAPTAGCVLALGFSGTSWLNASSGARAPGLRNISLLQPGYSASEADNFSSPFLALLANFPALRMADFMEVDNNTATTWDNHTSVLAPSYARQPWGMPFEVVVALCNALPNASCWFNLPVGGASAIPNDEYYRKIAELVMTISGDKRPVYIEYSNELWSPNFSQGAVSAAAAADMVATGDDWNLNYDRVNSTAVWAVRRVVAMLRHTAAEWEIKPHLPVRRGERYRPVYACHLSDPDYCRVGLEYVVMCLPQPKNAPGVMFQALAVAPYFSVPEPLNSDPALTVDAVLKAFSAAVAAITPDAAAELFYDASCTLAIHASFAYFYQIELHAFAGGPDTSGPADSPPAALLAKAQALLDPRMQAVSAAFIAAWAAHGPLAMTLAWDRAGASDAYGAGGAGAPGVVTDMLALPAASPRLAAIVAANGAAPPPCTLGPALPVLGWNATRFVGHNASGAAAPALTRLGLNATFDYFVRSTAAANVTLSVTVYMNCSTTAPAPEISVSLSYWNHQQVSVSPTGGAFLPQAAVVFTGLMAPGPQVVRLRVPEGSEGTYEISQIDFAVS